MTLTRWSPAAEMISLRDAMNSLFQESFVNRPVHDQREEPPRHASPGY